jgi:hypothetical protein
VNSLLIIQSSTEQVEIGWYQQLGDPLYHYFRATVFNGVYNLLSSQGGISGSHTYEVSYSAANNRWDYTIDSGSLWSTHTSTNGWTTAHPATNVERHSQSDSFSVGPHFYSLYFRTSSMWKTWSTYGAKCLFDDDPDLANQLPMLPDNSLLVALGAGNC